MNRVAYVRLDEAGTVVATGETDEAAFEALAPADAVRIPLGTAMAIGSPYVRAAAAADPVHD